MSLQESLIRAVKVKIIKEASIDRMYPRQSFTSRDRPKKSIVENITERFYIGLIKAKAPLKVTTQRGIESEIRPLFKK